MVVIVLFLCEFKSTIFYLTLHYEITQYVYFHTFSNRKYILLLLWDEMFPAGRYTTILNRNLSSLPTLCQGKCFFDYCLDENQAGQTNHTSNAVPTSHCKLR